MYPCHSYPLSKKTSEIFSILFLFIYFTFLKKWLGSTRFELSYWKCQIEINLEYHRNSFSQSDILIIENKISFPTITNIKTSAQPICRFCFSGQIPNANCSMTNCELSPAFEYFPEACPFACCLCFLLYQKERTRKRRFGLQT